MATHNHGWREGTKLCKGCRERQDKLTMFLDPKDQRDKHGLRLARTHCKDCIDEMVRSRWVALENGRTIVVYLVGCTQCHTAVPPEAMGGLYWCKKCHNKFSQQWIQVGDVSAKLKKTLTEISAKAKVRSAKCRPSDKKGGE